MRKQAVRSSVMYWAMFCCGNLAPDSIADVAVVLHMHLPKIFQATHPLSWKQYSMVAVASISRMMSPATKLSWKLEEWFKEHKKKFEMLTLASD